MKRILVVSSANMDFVQRMHRIPARGETVTEDLSYAYVPGGKGANSAVAFARLGTACVFCTCLGDDENGKVLRALYEKEGIDTSHIAISREVPTGLASIIVEEDGSNRIVVYPGANAVISEEDIRAAFDCLPVLLRFWEADEEFPAQLQLLWDRNTCRYLRYETTFYLSGEILRRLRESAAET